MCGIVGIFSRSGEPPFHELWRDLVNHLAHRGPDGGGLWANGPFFLGHRRLAIIDLNSGAQPMATVDGALVVTFNGEIYNYVELREELEKRGHRFQTTSDTEVLLHGYTEWQEELPIHLTGMFSFAIADRKRQQLFLARDRFGEKPLYIRRTPDYVAFGSELRPLASFPDLTKRINPQALFGYLCLNYVPGKQSLLDGIERLPPAGWALFSQREDRSGIYWQPPNITVSDDKRPLQDILSEWRELFDLAVKICLRSDVPVGVLLSGGIDSCLVAEAAARQGRLSCAYFLDFDDPRFSEYSAAKAVADRLSIQLERTVLRPDALAGERFVELVQHADDPMADSSALAFWTVSKLASHKNKVVLAGDGGDELYGGYMTYLATGIHSKWVTSMPMLFRKILSRTADYIPTSEGKVSFWYKVFRFLRAAHLTSEEAHYTWNGAWLPQDIDRIVTAPLQAEHTERVLAELLPDERLCSESPLLDLQLKDLANYLANDILVKSDRMSMAHGLEIRAPFLVHPVAEWALRRPDAQKVSRSGELKVILRAAARSVYGTAVANRRKQGFSIPIHEWVRGPFKEIVLDLLSPESLKGMSFLSATSVTGILDDHFSRRKSLGFEIWGLAVLASWFRDRVAGLPPKPPDLLLSEYDFG